MASTSESGIMKVEAADDGRAVAHTLQVGGGVSKKQRSRERLGCTTAKERISRMPPCVAGKRSSIYRGVTRWTGRYEAHLWDKSTWNQNQNKKGKQVYLGAYDEEEAAARAYDLAALKYWGAGTLINFPVSDYSRDLEEMQMVTKEEYLVSLRRKSSAFSRGFPKCRGTSRHVQGSRLEESLGHILASDPLVENKHGNSICMDRKINLTDHIRWWVPKRAARQPDSIGKSLDERHDEAEEDIIRELHALECQKQPTVPYQLPSLGVAGEKKARPSAVSACTVLSRSVAFKNFVHKLSEPHDRVCNPEDSGYEREGVSLGFGNKIPFQRTTQCSRAPVSTLPSCSVDHVPDALFWTSLVPPASLSMTTTAPKKTETSSPCP